MDNATVGVAPKSYDADLLRHIASLDLELQKENKRRYGDERPYLRYAFAADHVRRAKGSVARLLKLAIDEPYFGNNSHFPERRRLYDLQEGLRAAFAQERGTTYGHSNFQTNYTAASGRRRGRLRLTVA